MNYLVLSTIVITFSYCYERLRNKNKITKGLKWSAYAIICFVLCLFAGLRTRYNDTYAYIQGFLNTPKEFSSLFSSDFSISKVYLFKIWNYVIYHFISQNVHVYLFFSSILFVCPAVYLIDRYSKNLTFSMVLFMLGGMYLFSLAGLKQAMATGVLMLGVPALIKKKYFKYYIYCLLALGFHSYSIFFFILPLLGTDILNKRTILFCICVVFTGIMMRFLSGAISDLIEALGKDVETETITSGSVNIFRLLVFLVPLALTFIGRRKLQRETSEAEKVFIKMGVLSSLFMIWALFGNPILFGRIPQYFLVGIIISLPLLIEKVFVEKERKLMLIIAIVCYVVYGLYSLYIDGAFARDIFQLIWI